MELKTTLTPEPPSVETMKEAGTSQPPDLQMVPAASVRNPWLCIKCGAILGSVYHEKVRAQMSISRLILFRRAVLATEMLPLNHVFGKVDAGEIGCSNCGEVRHWHPSPETLRYLNEGNHHVGKKNRNF